MHMNKIVAADVGGRPPFSAFDICRKVKESTTGQKTMVLIISDFNNIDEVGQAVNAGTDDFIGKPVKKEELSKRVENLLKLSRL